MVAAGMCFAALAVMVKELSHIPPSTKLFFRNVVMFIVATVMIMKSKQSFKGNNQKLLILRSLLGLGGTLCYFIALSKLDAVADAIILNKLSPVFILIFASIFLKEKFGKTEIAVVLLGLAGAVLIIRPTFDASMLPALLGFVSAIFAGGAYVCVRELGKNNNPPTVMWYFALISIVGIIPVMFIEGFAVIDFSDALILLAVGILGSIGQYMITLAYKLAPVTKISVYIYSDVIFAILVSMGQSG